MAEEPNATLQTEEGKTQPVVVTLDPPLPEQIGDIHAEMLKTGGPGLLPGKPADNPVSQPATTTAEEDRRSEGQRRINYTWEYTQAGIAIAVVASTVLYHFLTLWVRPPDTTAALFFSSSFTLVIGFYFGRTNHSRGATDRAGSPQRNNVETVWDFRDTVQHKDGPR